MAVIERVRRALASVSDYVSQTVGPVSQQFGQAFGCEPWAVTVRPAAHVVCDGHNGDLHRLPAVCMMTPPSAATC